MFSKTCPDMIDVTVKNAKEWITKLASISRLRINGFGYLTIKEGATLDLPNLDQARCMIKVERGAKFIAPKLETIKGSFFVHKNAKIQTPKLRDITRSLDCYAALDMPNLKSVGAKLEVKGRLRAPELEYVDWLLLEANIVAPKLYSVRSLGIKGKLHIVLPNLNRAEFLYIKRDAQLTAPELKLPGR